MVRSVYTDSQYEPSEVDPQGKLDLALFYSTYN
jgi:hypothetical protein